MTTTAPHNGPDTTPERVLCVALALSEPRGPTTPPAVWLIPRGYGIVRVSPSTLGNPNPSPSTAATCALRNV